MVSTNSYLRCWKQPLVGLTLLFCYINGASGRALAVPIKTSQIRGGRINHGLIQKRQRQLLHPMHHGHGGTSYLGCLNYTNSELASEWSFSGSQPSCSYTSHGSNNDDDSADDDDSAGDDDSSGDDISGSNNGDDDTGEEGAGGNGEGADDDGVEGGDNDDNTEGAEGDDASQAGDDNVANDNNDDQNGNGNDGRNGNNGGDDDQYGNDDAYEVNNEDVAEGNDNGENPMESFDISDCSTYGNLWVWDLAFSCESDLSLDNCECTFTDQLMAAEMITCNDIESCPQDCPVCATCFQLAGCTPVIPDNVFERTGISASMLFAIAAVVGLFVFGAGYYYCRNKENGSKSSLGEHLLDEDLQETIKKIPPATGDHPDYDPEMEFPAGRVIPDDQSDLSSLASMSQTSLSEPSVATPNGGANVESEVELSPMRLANNDNTSLGNGTPDPDGAAASELNQSAVISSEAPLLSAASTSTSTLPSSNANTIAANNATANETADATKLQGGLVLSGVAGQGQTETATEDKPSDASDASPGDDSVSPWIGDIDLSFTEPSIDEDDEDDTEALLEKLDTPVAAEASTTTGTEPMDPPTLQSAPTDEIDDETFVDSTAEVGVEEAKPTIDSAKEAETPPDSSTAPAVKRKAGTVEEPPTGDVWLVPVDNAIVEDEFVVGEDSESPATAAEPIPETDAEVWLAPSADPADLSPVTRDDSSSASLAAWSEDGDAEGPWLAPDL